MPCLKFKEDEIAAIAGRYHCPESETALMGLKGGILERGHIAKDELSKVAHWKSPRRAGRTTKNSDQYVSEITRFAFATTCERARIESLTLLDGVSWPTASAILHLFHHGPYPILDIRALWSVSLDVPGEYSFDFWWGYVEFCRVVAGSAGVGMRTLDRALWQYSKENQPQRRE